jgi:tetratricopeptide (TPR) repeat protein
MFSTAASMSSRLPVRPALLCALVALVLVPFDIEAADDWIEVQSPHFTLTSNAGERGTRKLAWQLEQMRNAMTTLWTWMKPDLNKPLSVLVVKDETSMREFAPEYWEKRSAVRPASLWVTGPDQHYLAIRADVEVDDKLTLNPYVSAYFSYAGLVLDQSFDRDLPFWLRRGLTGVLSNTIVREDRVLFGPIIPWNLQIIRERPRIAMAKLLSVTRRSPEVSQSEFMQVYDAQTWALVHFLMFGDEGKHAPRLNAFLKLVVTGTDPAAAFAEALGSPDALEGAVHVYVQRNIFAYQRVNVDVSVERERFPVRKVSAAESIASRALWHAVMDRPVEARAAIAAARKADANAASTYTAEALILDRENKDADAKAAYAKAVELGTSSAYAHYRLAMMTWQPRPSSETLKEIDGLLSKAIERNTRYAAAYAWLGEIRAATGAPDVGLGFIRRAITLEPRHSTHRLRAANILLDQNKPHEARADAQAALALADDDRERREAQQLLDQIVKATKGTP